MAKTSLRLLGTPEVQSMLVRLMETPLPAEIGYQVVLVAKAVAEENQKLEKFRQTLIEKYGSRDPDNKLIIENDTYVLAHSQDFDVEYQHYLDIPVDVPRIPLAALAGVTLKPSTLAVLLQAVLTH